MLTISQLQAFDASSWTTTADALKKTEGELRDTGDGLHWRGNALIQNWWDPVGQMIGHRMMLHAQKYDDEAKKIKGLPKALSDAVTKINNAKKSLNDWLNYLKPMPVTVSDDGQTTIDWSKVKDDTWSRWFTQNRADYAGRKIRQALSDATQADTSAAEALATARDNTIEWPAGFDGGPLDLSPDGVRDSLFNTEQDDYGDCTLLAAITALGDVDPDWVKRNVKWNDETQTYTVSIYDRNGNKVDIVVDPRKLPSAGAHDERGSRFPTVASIIEEAIRQTRPEEIDGDDGDGFWHHEAFKALTGSEGKSSWTTPPTYDEVVKAVTRDPRSAVIVATYDRPLPDDWPEDKRLVQFHTYSVAGVDPDGNIVLRNPWGPDGGWTSVDGKLWPVKVPGTVTLTPDEYRRAFGSGGIMTPPY